MPLGLLFLYSGAQYMIILFMVFIVQISVSSACLAINKDQQVGTNSILTGHQKLILLHYIPAKNYSRMQKFRRPSEAA